MILKYSPERPRTAIGSSLVLRDPEFKPTVAIHCRADTRIFVVNKQKILKEKNSFKLDFTLNPEFIFISSSSHLDFYRNFVSFC